MTAFVLAAAMVQASETTAGRNAGGMLVLHANESLTYTDSENYCSQGALPGCADAIVTLDHTSPVTVFAYAAFDSTSSPELAGITFGIDYGAQITMLDSDICADFVLPTGDWPDAGSGTALTWSTPQVSPLIEVGWFAVAAYYGGPATISLTPHPIQGGQMADGSVPSVLDSVASFGSVGFDTFGFRPCADTTPTTTEDEGVVVAVLAPESVTMGADSVARAPEGVLMVDDQLRDALYATGVVAVGKSFPGSQPGDSLAVDSQGEVVRVPQLSRYYRFYYADSTSASSSLACLDTLSAVWLADHVPSVAIEYTEPVNDPYFDSWGSLSDAQWHLKNDGEHPSAPCGDPVAGIDIEIDGLEYWYEADGSQWVSVGILDTGIYDNHEDLLVWEQMPWDEIDFCGKHGTNMAGLAAAQTDNSVGIAGVCPDCKIIDLSIAESTPTGCTLRSSLIHERLADVEFYNSILGLVPISVVNIAVGPSGSPDITAAIARLWQLGTLTVRAGGTRSGDYTRVYGNPLSLDVAAYTFQGNFWDIATDCHDNPHPNHRSVAGPEQADITSPGSGSYLSLSEVQGYAITQGSTSGASAITSGVVAFLQGQIADEWAPHGGFPAPDLIFGFIQASALPYETDPTDEALDPSCTDCLLSDYGPGRINVAGASKLMWNYYFPDGFYWHERTADMDAATISPFGSPFTMWDREYRMYEVEVEVEIPSIDDPLLPEFVAFPDRRSNPGPDQTNSALAFFSPSEANNKLSLLLWAEDGITGCTMSSPDSNGTAVIRGYTFAYLEDGVEHFVIPISSLRMKYYTYHSGASSVEQTEGDMRMLELTVHGSPSGLPVVMQTRGLQRGATLTVFDASGRRIRAMDVSGTANGMADVQWDGRDNAGLPQPRGVYWARLADESGNQDIKRLVIVER